jgi:spermidine synthase
VIGLGSSVACGRDRAGGCRQHPWRMTVSRRSPRCFSRCTSCPGGTALVYQTLWNRELHLVFGTSTFAIATVLSAFMARSCARAARLMARRADACVASAASCTGLLEAFIGRVRAGLPVRSSPSDRAGVPRRCGGRWSPGRWLFGLIQFALVGVALVLPTAAMGATLPVLARFATDRLGRRATAIGVLYAVNTAGAVVGHLAGGLHPAAVARPVVDDGAGVAAINVALGAGRVGVDRAGRR